MATNQVFKDDEKTRRVRVVGNDIAPGTAVVVEDGAGVTLTGSGDYQRTTKMTLPDGTEATFVDRQRGGVGLADDEATVTFSGSFAFVFTGSDEAAVGAEVEIDPTTGELSIDEDGTGTGVALGIVDFVRPEDGAAVVKIGV